MLDGPSWQFILLTVLILASAFFSASETALVSLSRIRLRHLVEEGNPKAIKIQKLVENPNQLIGAILVGNNIVNIAASALATSLAIRSFGSNGVGIATGAMTLLVLVFGEITPKSLAATYSETMSLALAGFMTFYVKLMSPLVWFLLLITNVFTKIFGAKSGINQFYMTEEELKTMVHVSHEEGVLEVEEKEMIYNVFDFGESQVRDVMTPRTEVISIEIDSTYEKVLETYKQEQFSRVPIYKENTDNMVGVLYIKDLLLNNADPQNFHISEFMREPFFTFEFKRTTELFKEMRAKRVPIAIVLDEYGGTAGIVTLEDLIEEIVGEIRDEYDDHEEEIEIVKEDEFLVDGTMRIDELNEMIGIDIHSEDFDSIGGFIVGEFGYIPEAGEFLDYNGIKFVVEQVDRNRIEKLRIHT